MRADRFEARGGERRVLISTISLEDGGVPANVRFIVRTLRDRGYEPILAHYEPYSRSPHLSVPSLKLLQRRVGSEIRHACDHCEAHAIGAWLPELEFTHYRASLAWQRVMDSCSAFLTVSGNTLASLPYVQTGRPFVSWIASGWHLDRKHRAQRFSVGRQVLDRAVVSPVVGRLERSILHNGSVLALSSYTRRLLDEIAGAAVVKDVLPSPIDTNFFSPAPKTGSSWRIGFSGRLNDPRKNLGLLLDALHILRRDGHAVRAVLVGGEPDQALCSRLKELAIGDAVEFCGYVPPETLRDKLRTLDLFVVPSHQEGLCIAALEAMACGCPVVSTRCGGPEEFVLDDETGVLVGFESAEMADAILGIVGAPKLRRRLGTAARQKVVQDYSFAKANGIFWKAFDERFVSAGLAA